MIRRGLTPSNRVRMRYVAESSMQDECYHLNRVATQNRYGEDAVTWVQDADPLICGYAPERVVENRATGEVQIFAAKLRLPLSAEGVVGSEDMVVITRRFGADLTTPLEYAVDGAPVPGPSALVLSLRRAQL